MSEGVTPGIQKTMWKGMENERKRGKERNGRDVPITDEKEMTGSGLGLRRQGKRKKSERKIEQNADRETDKRNGREIKKKERHMMCERNTTATEQTRDGKRSYE